LEKHEFDDFDELKAFLRERAERTDDAFSISDRPLTGDNMPEFRDVWDWLDPEGYPALQRIQEQLEALQKRYDALAQGDEVWVPLRRVEELAEQLETAQKEREQLRELLADVWGDLAHQLDEPLASKVSATLDVYRYAALNPASIPKEKI
jgi:DNA repair exonuclease SbcCD ATPase subunit